jgi:hypothetical protein
MAQVLIQCPGCSARLKLPERPPAGRSARCPKCNLRFVLSDHIRDPVEKPPVNKIAAEDLIQAAEPQPITQSPHSSEASILQQVRSRRKRKNRSFAAVRLTLVSLVVFAIAVVAFVFRHSLRPEPKEVQLPPVSFDPAATTETTESGHPDLRSQIVVPAAGPPVPVLYFPFVPQLICHLRPSELWSEEPQMLEYRASWGETEPWLRGLIRQMTRLTPQDVSELTLAVNFGSRNSIPEIAAVAVLTEDAESKLSVKDLGGRPRSDISETMFEFDEICMIQIDSRTIATASPTLAEDLNLATKTPPVPPSDLSLLLSSSDRTRQLTLLFDISLLETHRNFLLSRALQQTAKTLHEHLGENLRAVSLSLHLHETFVMEAKLLPSVDSSLQRLRTLIRNKLNQLPDAAVTAVRGTVPVTVGEQRLAGRFPAMLKAVELGSTVNVTPKVVRIFCQLPQPAAASLAAGSTVTLKLSQRAVSSSEGASADGSIPGKQTIEQRISRQIPVDFRNQPLQEAISYIAAETDIVISIDGDALKSAGFTQNMAQTFSLGRVPASAALDAILAKYAAERDPLVICIDPAGETLILTTKLTAEKKGQSIFLPKTPAD